MEDRRAEPMNELVSSLEASAETRSGPQPTSPPADASSVDADLRADSGASTLPYSPTLPYRFDKKVERNSNTDCWIWRGFIDKAGYARIKAGGKYSEVLYAHRYSYERHVAPIPAGLCIDHLCRVRHCVNPAHLEPVTQRENTLRGESPAAAAARRTHCPRGHAYDVFYPKRRRCSICDRERDRLRSPRRRPR